MNRSKPSKPIEMVDNALEKGTLPLTEKGTGVILPPHSCYSRKILQNFHSLFW